MTDIFQLTISSRVLTDEIAEQVDETDLLCSDSQRFDALTPRSDLTIEEDKVQINEYGSTTLVLIEAEEIESSLPDEEIVLTPGQIRDTIHSVQTYNS